MLSNAAILKASIGEIAKAAGLKMGTVLHETGAFDFLLEYTGNDSPVEFACRFLADCRRGDGHMDRLACAIAIHFLDTVTRNRPTTFEEQKARMAACIAVVPNQNAFKQYEVWAASWF